MIDKETPHFTIKDWLIAKKLHIIIWALFITYEAVIVSIFNGKFGKLPNYILFYALNISLFYVHTHLILAPSLKSNNQIWWRLPLLLAAELIAYLTVYIFFDFLIISFMDYASQRKINLNISYFVGPVYRSIYFMFFSTGYHFLIKFLNEKKKSEDLEKLKLINAIQLARSENAYLKAQIQPHFLFNTLDFIYHNARENSPIAAETILSLSEMMRYAIDSNKDKDFIVLEEEINQVENLINLHQLRKNHQLKIRFWYDDDIKKTEIIPLVLVTLVENMFKHGNMLLESHPAEIKLYTKNDCLHIETVNLIKVEKENIGFNTGLENIIKRLNYSYGNRSRFENYVTENGYYIVKIVIKTVIR